MQNVVNHSRPAELLVIEAGHLDRHYWRELWRNRELLYFLALRDLSVRYKQTFFGVAWVLLRPLITMAVFTIVFGKLAGLPSGAVPYPVMVLAGMLIWMLFAGCMTDSGNSIVNNAGMISKVYFPRLIVPLSTMLIHLVDFVIASLLLIAIMIWYRVVPDWRILTLPAFLLLALVTSIGIGLWLAALNVKYRDFRILVTFAIQLGLYISPVGFSSVIVPEQWRLLYSLNPMAGIIDGFRWSLLGGDSTIYWPGVLISACVAFGLLFTGVRHFRAAEKSFTDYI
jgi:lipopolysaccharide transport system permease protein